VNGHLLDGAHIVADAGHDVPRALPLEVAHPQRHQVPEAVHPQHVHQPLPEQVHHVHPHRAQDLAAALVDRQLDD